MFGDGKEVWMRLAAIRAQKKISIGCGQFDIEPLLHIIELRLAQKCAHFAEIGSHLSALLPVICRRKDPCWIGNETTSRSLLASILLSARRFVLAIWLALCFRYRQTPAWLGSLLRHYDDVWRRIGCCAAPCAGGIFASLVSLYAPVRQSLSNGS